MAALREAGRRSRLPRQRPGAIHTPPQVGARHHAMANGNGGVVEVGELVAYMRGRNRPMGTWEVRGELSTLQAAGLIAVDDKSATWHPVEGQDFDSAYAAA